METTTCSLVFHTSTVSMEMIPNIFVDSIVLNTIVGLVKLLTIMMDLNK
jgi:hypothetical protein